MNRHKIIVNADDLFMNEWVDEQIVAAAVRGEISSCSGFATSPQTSPLETTKKLGGPCPVGVGVHLDLSFGTLLTPALRGERLACALANQGAESTALLELEFDAQFEEMSRRVPCQVTHIDNHRPEVYFAPAQYAAVVAVASRRKVPIRSPFGLTLDDMIACIAKGDANVERNLHGLAEIQRETEARLEVSRPDAFVSLGIMKSRSAEILGRVFASPSRPLVVEIGVHIHRDDEKNLLAEILATLRKMGTPFDCVSFQALHPDATRP